MDYTYGTTRTDVVFCESNSQCTDSVCSYFEICITSEYLCNTNSQVYDQINFKCLDITTCVDDRDCNYD